MNNPFKKKATPESAPLPLSPLYAVMADGDETWPYRSLDAAMQHAHRMACQEGYGATPTPQIIYRLVPIARVERGQPLVTPLDDE